jgi:hypothetical protein
MYYHDFLEILKRKYKIVNVEDWHTLIECEKKELTQFNNDDVLLHIWMCLEVISAVGNYHEAFQLMKDRQYNKGWDKLARAEINISNIIYNIQNYRDYLVVPFLKQYVRKYQSIYPYKMFSSMVSVIKESECSICHKNMDPFSGCKHIKGKVYSGELCYEIVKDMDLLGFDMVTDPSMRECVAFLDIENPLKYQLLEYLIPRLKNEYSIWDYEILEKYEPHNKYNIQRNERCPCNSGKKYKNCCMSNPKGIKYDHYEFILPNIQS